MGTDALWLDFGELSIKCGPRMPIKRGDSHCLRRLIDFTRHLSAPFRSPTPTSRARVTTVADETATAVANETATALLALVR